MKTIVLATRKGGSGKSTIAIGLAIAAIQAGQSVRLIETDPQGTLTNWRGRRIFAEPIVEPLYTAGEIEPRLMSLASRGLALTIIDTAAGPSAATTAAIRHADFCLIPARASVADIEGTVTTVKLVRDWKKPFAFVLNQTPVHGRRIGNAATALGNEDSLGLSDVLAQPFIVMRNDHQDALSMGLGVNELAPTGKAAQEIRSLWQWLAVRLHSVVQLRPTVGNLLPPQECVRSIFLEGPSETTELVSWSGL